MKATKLNMIAETRDYSLKQKVRKVLNKQSIVAKIHEVDDKKVIIYFGSMTIKIAYNDYKCGIQWEHLFMPETTTRFYDDFKDVLFDLDKHLRYCRYVELA